MQLNRQNTIKLSYLNFTVEFREDKKNFLNHRKKTEKDILINFDATKHSPIFYGHAYIEVQVDDPRHLNVRILLSISSDYFRSSPFYQYFRILTHALHTQRVSDMQ